MTCKLCSVLSDFGTRQKSYEYKAQSIMANASLVMMLADTQFYLSSRKPQASWHYTALSGSYSGVYM